MIHYRDSWAVHGPAVSINASNGIKAAIGMDSIPTYMNISLQEEIWWNLSDNQLVVILASLASIELTEQSPCCFLYLLVFRQNLSIRRASTNEDDAVVSQSPPDQAN